MEYKRFWTNTREGLRMDLELKDRVYYVTGVSSGIGLAIATTLLAEGAYVFGCARDASIVSAAEQALPDPLSKRATFVSCDVLNEQALASSVNLAGEHLGRLDGVVAAAGRGTTGNAHATSNSAWMAQAEMKLLSVLNLVRPAVPWLTAAPNGAICLINGVTAHHPEADMAATSAARAAVANLGRTLAEDLAGSVRAFTVNPGAIRTARQTDRWRAAIAAGQDVHSFEEWEQAEARRRGILLERFGTAEEVADVVAFLISARASYITGVSVDVSGGSRGRP